MTPDPDQKKEPKRERTKGLKHSRNGRYSCKKRKIKCDEGKPDCKRCIAFGVTCEYVDKNAKNSVAARRILRPAIRVEPSIRVFESDSDQWYFHAFATSFAPRTALTTPFSCKGVLTHLLPQTAWNEPSLRNAYIALGALSRSQTESDDQILDQTATYEYALRKYQQALVGMQAVQSLRTALVACILIYSFEKQLRRHDLAFRQLAKGFKLLERYLDDGEHAGVEVEDALVKTYRSLEYHSLDATGISSRRLHKEVLGRVPISNSLKTIEEAREALELNSAQALYLRNRFWFEGENIPLTEFVSTGGRWKAPEADEMDDFVGRSRAITALDEQWFAAAEPLWKRVQATGGSDYYRMAGLRVTALYYWLHQLGMSMPHHGFDQYTSYFQEIIRLTRDIMDFEGKDGANDCMETGIILPLSLVVGACRHYPTQQEGFRLLLGAQKKRGSWKASR